MRKRDVLAELLFSVAVNNDDFAKVWAILKSDIDLDEVLITEIDIKDENWDEKLGLFA